MSLYTIKHVPANEKQKLIDFIQNHWKRNHALAISSELLDFQHLDTNQSEYHFIVAENNETKEYDALIGYIPVGQYDKELLNNGDYWGAIWKMREDIHNSELNTVAFFLWKQLFKLPQWNSYGAIGISNIAKQIYLASRICVAQLNQYHLLNDKIQEFCIANGVSEQDFARSKLDNIGESLSIKQIDIHTIEKASLKGYYKPLKSIMYLKNRYVNHPIYEYMFLGAYREEELRFVLVIRRLCVNNSCCYRIVDVLGKLEGDIYSSLKQFLYETGAEYIDCLNYGISNEVFFALGFKLLDPQGELIIPNYFEPFEKRNVIIDIAYKATYPDYVAFKADSDQDRPNIL